MAEGNEVKLYVYDLSQGLASQLSLPLLGKKLDGIWHTGVVVYGTEFFFGSMGISNCAPGCTILGAPLQVINLGSTFIPRDLFQEFLIGLGDSTFQGSRYHLFEHNCNNFSNEVSQFLVGTPIPAHITGLPADVLATPFGAAIRPLIESMAVQPAAAPNMQHSPSPYVAPVPSTQAVPPSQAHRAPAAAAGRSERPFPLATPDQDSASAVKVDADRGSGARHSAASSSFSGVNATLGGAQRKMYAWNVPLMLFQGEECTVQIRATRDPASLGRCQQLACAVPCFTMPPSLEEGVFVGNTASSSDGVALHVLECVECLKNILKDVEGLWLEKANARGLAVDAESLSRQLTGVVPASDAEGLSVAAMLAFALTVSAGDDARFSECPRRLARLLDAMWPTWKCPECKDLRIAVLYSLTQLSVNQEWQRHLLSDVEWQLGPAKRVSNIQLLLPVLVDGLLDEYPAIQQLALRCLNNLCMRLESKPTALELGAALVEYLQEPRPDLSEVAFLALFRCLAVNEEELALVLATTGIPSETFAVLGSPELREAVTFVKALLE